MTPTAIQPLHIDETVEGREEGRLGRRFLRWLRLFVPIVTGPPRGRKSVEMQLSARTRFPIEFWEEYGLENEVVAILQIIEREMCWPNHHFAPQDPLLLAVTASLDTYDGSYAIDKIEKRYGINYSQEDLKTMAIETWTLGHFVQDVLGRASDS